MESNYGVITGKTTMYLFYLKHCFFTDFHMIFNPCPPSIISQRIYTFYKIHHTELNSGNQLKKQEKNHHCLIIEIIAYQNIIGKLLSSQGGMKVDT